MRPKVSSDSASHIFFTDDLQKRGRMGVNGCGRGDFDALKRPFPLMGLNSFAQFSHISMKTLVEDEELTRLRAMAEGSKPFVKSGLWERLAALELKEIMKLPARER